MRPPCPQLTARTHCGEIDLGRRAVVKLGDVSVGSSEASSGKAISGASS